MAWIDVVDSCEIIGTTQGAFACGVVKNSVIRDGGDSFDAAAHENGAWLQNNQEFYNNVMFNWVEGVAVYVIPGR